MNIKFLKDGDYLMTATFADVIFDHPSYSRDSWFSSFNKSDTSKTYEDKNNTYFIKRQSSIYTSFKDSHPMIEKQFAYVKVRNGKIELLEEDRINVLVKIKTSGGGTDYAELNKTKVMYKDIKERSTMAFMSFFNREESSILNTQAIQANYLLSLNIWKIEGVE